MAETKTDARMTDSDEALANGVGVASHSTRSVVVVPARYSRTTQEGVRFLEHQLAIRLTHLASPNEAEMTSVDVDLAETFVRPDTCSDEKWDVPPLNSDASKLGSGGQAGAVTSNGSGVASHSARTDLRIETGVEPTTGMRESESPPAYASVLDGPPPYTAPTRDTQHADAKPWSGGAAEKPVVVAAPEGGGAIVRTVRFKKLQYRPELDGLRAIAVLPVVLFHFKCGFRGGFSGVDVFFVISGFLITAILLFDLDRQGFSIRNFWLRRCRRLFPALVLVLIFTLIYAWHKFLAESYTAVKDQTWAVLLLGGNFYFYGKVEYFRNEAEEPLLHCWSLAVEEQVYLACTLVRIYISTTSWGMPTASVEGPIGSEGSVQKVSVRRVFRYVQADTGPRRSPSACSEIFAKKKQFYLAWPLMLYALWFVAKDGGASRRAVLLLLAILFAASLAASIAVSSNEEHRSFNYYLLPTRAWEMLLGG